MSRLASMVAYIGVCMDTMMVAWMYSSWSSSSMSALLPSTTLLTLPFRCVMKCAVAAGKACLGGLGPAGCVVLVNPCKSSVRKDVRHSNTRVATFYAMASWSRVQTCASSDAAAAGFLGRGSGFLNTWAWAVVWQPCSSWHHLTVLLPGRPCL